MVSKFKPGDRIRVSGYPAGYLDIKDTLNGSTGTVVPNSPGTWDGFVEVKMDDGPGSGDEFNSHALLYPDEIEPYDG